jgi:HD superfamily phosphohydrolase YqeK
MASIETDRTERVRQVVDEVLRGQKDFVRRAGFIHLYGVAQFCALLALVRGLDAELGTVAGMLHDLVTYQTGDDTDHGRRSAVLAHGILSDLGCFAEDEAVTICTAIAHHRIKDQVHGAYDELLKDADVLSHTLYNTQLPPIDKERARLSALWAELGIEHRP